MPVHLDLDALPPLPPRKPGKRAKRAYVPPLQYICTPIDRHAAERERIAHFPAVPTHLARLIIGTSCRCGHYSSHLEPDIYTLSPTAHGSHLHRVTEGELPSLPRSLPWTLERRERTVEVCIECFRLPQEGQGELPL